jgi:hypothetical protein
LPNCAVKELATNESKLKQALDNKQSYLIASLAARGNQVNLIAIARLQCTMPNKRDAIAIVPKNQHFKLFRLMLKN